MNGLINVFKILSDETRIRILVLLYREKLCVCELCGILNVSQPKISKCLSKLRDQGLVTDERQEKFVYYSLKTENQVLIGTIENIMSNLESYPILAKDIAGISGKEKYSNQCCPKVE